MRLSEERIAHLSHLILKGLVQDGLVEPLTAEERLFRDIKRTITAALMEEDEIDTYARRKIQSLSRPVPEGGAEWQVLYRKYKEEEMRRRRKA